MWERWVKDSKHGLSASEADWLLDQLRACAWAPLASSSDGKPQDFHFKMAVQILQNSDLWKSNGSIQQWLTTTWLNMPKVIKTNDDSYN